MKQTVRRNVLVTVLVLPLLGGCAGDACERLILEGVQEPARPLVLPEGVQAPAEGGEYRIPDARAAAAPATAGGCLAQPPMTLPPEMLKEPEDEEESGAE